MPYHTARPKPNSGQNRSIKISAPAPSTASVPSSTFRTSPTTPLI